jgi:hypothetical protein
MLKWVRRPPLFRRHLGMVNDENLHGGSLRFQFQPS